MEFNTRDILIMSGWIITFFFGIVATLITQRYSKERKVLSWTVSSESDVLSGNTMSALSGAFGVPLKILVDGKDEPSISTVRLKIANTGNTELKKIKLHFNFGDLATAHVGQIVGEVGVYKDELKMSRDGNKAEIEINYINKGQSFEVEFLVGKYIRGDVCVDMAAPGVEFKQADKVQLEAALTRVGVEIMSIGLPGISYNKTYQTSNLINEVKLLRSTIEKAVQKIV